MNTMTPGTTNTKLIQARGELHWHCCVHEEIQTSESCLPHDYNPKVQEKERGIVKQATEPEHDACCRCTSSKDSTASVALTPSTPTNKRARALASSVMESCLVHEDDSAMVSSRYGYKCEYPNEDLQHGNIEDARSAGSLCKGYCEIAPKNTHRRASSCTDGADHSLQLQQDRLKTVSATLQEATMVAMLFDKALAEKRVTKTKPCSVTPSSLQEEGPPPKRRRFQRRNSVVIIPKQAGAAGFPMLTRVPIGVIGNTNQQHTGHGRETPTKVARAG